MKAKKKDITGIILAGGCSTRMGTDKSLLRLGNGTVIEKVRDLMTEIFENVLLSTNNLEQHRFLGLEMVPDLYENRGPVSGIHASLISSRTHKNFFLSCDLPLISREIIRYIIDYDSPKQIVVPIVEGEIQPLCGVFRKSLIPLIEEMIGSSLVPDKEKGKISASVKRLIEKADTDYINAKILHFFNDNLFFNMNTASDYEIIKKKFTE